MDSKERQIFLKDLIIIFLAVIAIDLVIENVVSLVKEGYITYSISWTQIVSFVLVSAFAAYLSVRRHRKKEIGY